MISLPQWNVTENREGNDGQQTHSIPTRGELVRALRERYMESTKKEKTKILDEFSSVAGYHRKHAVRLLGRHSRLPHPSRQGLGRRIYNAAVVEALIITWEAADRLAGND